VCNICQIPESADADALPLFDGDSLPLRLKASAADGKSSTTDYFFNDNFEDKTKKLQLVVCYVFCVRQWMDVFVF